MSSMRLLVAASTNDAVSDEDIRTIEAPSTVEMWASCVTLTDLVGLRLNKTVIRDDAIVNIHAAALSLVNRSDDGVVGPTVIGTGELRVPVTVTTSAIVDVEHHPII